MGARSFLSRAGLIGLWFGLVGGVMAVVMIAWPEQTPQGPLHYPFTRTGFFVAQTTFFVHHIGLVVLMLGLAKSGALGTNKILRGAVWLAVAGMVMLTVNELIATQFADTNVDVANKGALGALYGIATNVIGLGLILSGIGVVRARVWSGWRRWMPLVTGIAVFVELTPGMFAGYVVARMAIGFWMLLFGALGWALYSESQASTSAAARSPASIAPSM